jgi:hypothetical protein
MVSFDLRASLKDSRAAADTYSVGTGVLPRLQSGRDVKFTTHLDLAPRLRMNGVILPLPVGLPAFIAWAGTVLPSYLFYHPLQIHKLFIFLD